MACNEFFQLDFCNTAVTINQQVSKDDKVALNDLGVDFRSIPKMDSLTKMEWKLCF